jgi:microcin C transport system ATP-binding protein
MADRVCVMTKGKIVEQGRSPTSSPPAAPYTKHLLAAEPKGRAAGRRDARRAES